MRRTVYSFPSSPVSKSVAAAPSLHHAVALVLRRHRHEVAEALLEFRRAVARALDPADADALVARREAAEVRPRRGLRSQRTSDVGRDDESARARELHADGSASRGPHPS